MTLADHTTCRFRPHLQWDPDAPRAEFVDMECEHGVSASPPFYTAVYVGELLDTLRRIDAELPQPGAVFPLDDAVPLLGRLRSIIRDALPGPQEGVARRDPDPLDIICEWEVQGQRCTKRKHPGTNACFAHGLERMLKTAQPLDAGSPEPAEASTTVLLSRLSDYLLRRERALGYQALGHMKDATSEIATAHLDEARLDLAEALEAFVDGRLDARLKRMVDDLVTQQTERIDEAVAREHLTRQILRTLNNDAPAGGGPAPLQMDHAYDGDQTQGGGRCLHCGMYQAAHPMVGRLLSHPYEGGPADTPYSFCRTCGERMAYHAPREQDRSQEGVDSAQAGQPLEDHPFRPQTATRERYCRDCGRGDLYHRTVVNV